MVNIQVLQARHASICSSNIGPVTVILGIFLSFRTLLLHYCTLPSSRVCLWVFTYSSALMYFHQAEWGLLHYFPQCRLWLAWQSGGGRVGQAEWGVEIISGSQTFIPLSPAWTKQPIFFLIFNGLHFNLNKSVWAPVGWRHEWVLLIHGIIWLVLCQLCVLRVWAPSPTCAKNQYAADLKVICN